jgi:hypothetical protein
MLAVLGVLGIGVGAVAGAGEFAPGSRTTSASTPAMVVAAYIAALDRHDPAAVCGLFAPQLRRYEAHWDAPPEGRRTCRGAVAGHFRDYYSRHRWASARSRGPVRTTIDPRTGFAAVRFVLVHRYVCARHAPPEPCHPGRYVRPEIIYLLRSKDQWKVIKPGLVYRASEIDQPLDEESDYYPPGDAATINGPTNLPAPKRRCPASRTVTVSPRHALQNTFEPNPNGKPGHVPGLTIRSFSAARISRTTVCFTLTLAGPPRPDFSYDVSLGTVAQHAAADLFDIQIDGLGNPHALVAGRGALNTPGIARYLPKVFASGNRLEIIAAHPILALHRFIIMASSESIQDDEPLLTRPLDAGDDAPLHGCLIFPTGRLTTRGLCGSGPGP